MVISAGWEQEPLIMEAKKIGLWVLATDANENASGLSIADKYEIANPRDLGKCLQIAKDNKIGAVIADQCDYSIFTSAYIAEALNLPGPRIKYAQAANKKWTRLKCKEFGIVQPEFRVVLNLDEARKGAKEIGFPIVTKPVDNRGAFGTKIVDSFDSLDEAYLEALANSHSREVLVEKKIEGIHLTVDGFAFGKGKHKSLAVASKDILEGPRPIVKNVYYPARIEKEIIRHVKTINNTVIEKLGIEYGATHVEYVLDKRNRLFLLEVAPRGGGVHTASKIIPAITGINISKLLIKWALGEKLNYPKDSNGKWNAAYLGFIVFKPGKIKKIKGIEKLKDIPGLLHFQLLVKEGDTLGEVKSGAHRHGFYITADAKLDGAISKGKEIVSLLDVEYI